MNDNAALHALSSDVAVLKRDYAGLHADVSSLVNKIDNLSTQVAAQQRTNWPLILATGTVLLAVVGGGWRVVDLQNRLTVAQAISPLEARLARDEEDSADIQGRLERQSVAVSANTKDVSEIRRDLREVETQFCALSNIVNLRDASHGRLVDQLWRKVMGQPLSDDDYMPSVGRCEAP